MKKLLVITGDLAAGKSTFSQMLSQRCQVSVFNKDSIKETLADTMGFANAEESVRLSRAAVELMLLIFRSFAKLDRDLILEANFHRPELERLYQLARERQYEVRVLALQGDIETLHKRYRNRMEHEDRHPAHLSNSFGELSGFRTYVEASRRETFGDDIVFVDATDFSYQRDPALLAALDAVLQ